MVLCKLTVSVTFGWVWAIYTDCPYIGIWNPHDALGLQYNKISGRLGYMFSNFLTLSLSSSILHSFSSSYYFKLLRGTF